MWVALSRVRDRLCRLKDQAEQWERFADHMKHEVAEMLKNIAATLKWMDREDAPSQEELSREHLEMLRREVRAVMAENNDEVLAKLGNDGPTEVEKREIPF